MLKRVLCCLALVACAAAGARAQRTAPDAGRRPAPAVLEQRPAGGLSVPRPQLAWKGLDANVKGSDGKPYVGVTLGVTNYAAYPGLLFARSPELPACGANAAAARTWLRVYNAGTQKEVYSYCAFAGPSDLRTFSFNVARAELPAEVYVVLDDRAAKRRYHSNCLKTADGSPCGKGPGEVLTGTEVLAAPAVTPEVGFQVVHGRDPNPEEAKMWRAAVLKEGLTQEELNKRILQKLITNPDVWSQGEMKMIVVRAFGAAGKGSPTPQQQDYWANRILMGTAYHKIIVESLKK